MDDPVQHRLRERVKELTALHRTSRILQDHTRPTGELLAEIVDLLPGAWQYPEVAAARIRYRGREYATSRFRSATWAQRAEFGARTGERGDIAVVYLEERPAADEGPFLAEERDLIDSLADLLRHHLEHQLADEALRRANDALEMQVRERTADLRRLATQLTLAEAMERRRIALHRHDHVGQALALIKIQALEFQSNAVFGGFEDVIENMLRLLNQTIRYTRELTGEISPPVLHELGLEPALDWLAQHFSETTALQVAFTAEGAAVTLPDDLAVMVYMSARELLTNSLKHSGAHAADLALCWRDDVVEVRVSDRGVGFDSSVTSAAGNAHFGLFSVRERLDDLGGAVQIVSRPGEGCRAILTVPI